MIMCRHPMRVFSYALLILTISCTRGAAPVLPRARLPVTSVLSGEAQGFARAQWPREFVFPQDHAEHSDFRNEWWYLTGHLTDGGGGDIGYQLTFFRTALLPEAPGRASAWAAQNLYMGHFSLSDVVNEKFHFAERFARGALGLAGTTVDPLSVWIESWRMDALPAEPGSTPGDLPELRLLAAEESFALDLRLRASRPPVAHGDNGLSRKGVSPGNASHYYSVTRLATEGVVRVGALTYKVTGSSWFDREWSTSALEPRQVGWDWFSLQLSDGRDLMLYLMRRVDGTSDLVSSGTLVSPDGSAVHLQRADFDVLVLDQWRSSEGVSYPSRWQIRVPSIDLELEVEPMLADQEFTATFRYWEGLVRAQGRATDQAISARGFVELTGYPTN